MLSIFSQTLKLTGRREEIADKILKEISQRLRFLVDVGLDYLTLNRRQKHSQAVKHNVFVWQAKLARA